ncbi:nuclear transport factor 2 family protein [Aquisediminimonas sediminicola]|uniref:nuclear transport factor 2 family protein n=1 Tax=Alteraquisediminimonas sediminicola TaxID=2676787 RepID=UPI001FE30929|nr:nuclear transport factor 2 family protein [Aquisediminimonas sediminicola]
MNALEKRVRMLEDRAALEGVLLQYYYAVDTLSDVDSLVDCFTPDAIFDIEDLGLKVYHGHSEIRTFFEGVFATTPYHCHHVSNFDVTRLEENEASARGYVIGKAEGDNGVKVLVHCCYNIEYVRTDAGWKMRLFDEDSLVPIGDEVRDLHG